MNARYLSYCSLPYLFLMEPRTHQLARAGCTIIGPLNLTCTLLAQPSLMGIKGTQCHAVFYRAVGNLLKS